MATQAPEQTELKPKERAFIEHYLRSWNAADAARQAGYSERSARELGRRLLTKVDIRAEIEARLSDMQMGTDEVLTRLTDQARGTIEDFGDVDKYGTFSMDLSKAQERGRLGNVKKLKPTKYGYELELHDAQAALVHIGKARGMFIDRKEISGPDGAAIPVKVLKGKTLASDLLPKSVTE